MTNAIPVGAQNVPNDPARQAPKLAGEFRRLFGAAAPPRFFQAPGRVNLIGEHTDYNAGFVMPAAIQFWTFVAAAPRNDDTVAVHSIDFGETREFRLRDVATRADHHWSDYIRGVVLELQLAGVDLKGTNLLVSGNVPMGAGLSSSASVEVATALALAELFNANLSLRELALLCQRAENNYVGARCGIMDQFIASHGREGHALMLDCRSLDYELLPLPGGVSLIICNTMVKHQIAGGEYNVRRRECEEGVRFLQQRFPEITALRDVTPEMLTQYESSMPPVVYRRCRHVVSENARVLSAAEALRNSDLTKFGHLMYESHDSLRDDYQVSCPELDLMVQLASAIPGVTGARMTGGGFGGCTINLVNSEVVEKFRRDVGNEYRAKTGLTPQIYVTQASNGASEIQTGDES
jgi:galactokinase